MVVRINEFKDRNNQTYSREGNMIRKVFSTIRHLHPISGFDSYFSSVQLHGGAVGPTIDEAKRDFRNRIISENGGFIN